LGTRVSVWRRARVRGEDNDTARVLSTLVNENDFRKCITEKRFDESDCANESESVV